MGLKLKKNKKIDMSQDHFFLEPRLLYEDGSISEMMSGVAGGQSGQNKTEFPVQKWEAVWNHEPFEFSKKVHDYGTYRKAIQKAFESGHIVVPHGGK